MSVDRVSRYRTAGRKYRRAMWAAIQQACDNGGPSKSLFGYKNDLPAIWGLRAVRDFERRNQCRFDPFDRYHLQLIRGHGRHKVHVAYMRAMVETLSSVSAGLRKSGA